MRLQDEARRLLDMPLEDLRKQAFFQNSIDVWIEACTEKNIDWHNTAQYKNFIKHLQDSKMDLKKYTLCVSDAESADDLLRKKAGFAEELSKMSDSESSTYSIKLTDSAINTIREHWN